MKLFNFFIKSKRRNSREEIKTFQKKKRGLLFFSKNENSNNEESISEPYVPWEKQKGKTRFTDLPFDCVGVIIEFICSIHGIIKLMSTCKELQEYISSTKERCFKNFVFTLDFSTNSQITKDITFIYRLNCYGSDNLSTKELEHFPSLRELTINYCDHKRIDLKTLFSKLPNLEYFEVPVYLQLQQDTFKYINKGIKTLKIRRYSRISTYIKTDKFPVDEIGLFAPLLACKELKELQFFGVSFKHEKEFIEIIKVLKNLKILLFNRCTMGKINVQFPERLEELTFHTSETSQLSFPNLPESLKKFVCDTSPLTIKSILVTRLPKLEYFAFNGKEYRMERLEKSHFQMITKQCPELKYLSVIGKGEKLINDSIFLHSFLDENKKLESIRTNPSNNYRSQFKKSGVLKYKGVKFVLF